jgi:hypothetical protein
MAYLCTAAVDDHDLDSYLQILQTVGGEHPFPFHSQTTIGASKRPA